MPRWNRFSQPFSFVFAKVSFCMSVSAVSNWWPHPHGIGQSANETQQILLPIRADFWGRTPAVLAG